MSIHETFNTISQYNASGRIVIAADTLIKIFFRPTARI